MVDTIGVIIVERDIMMFFCI